MEAALREGINNILNQRVKLKAMQDSLKEDVSAIAERFDMKPAQLNKVIGLVEKEREKGGVLKAEQGLLEMAVDAAV